MNILILTSDYLPNALWGMGQYVQTLVNGINQYNPETVVYIATAHKSRKFHDRIITTSQEEDDLLLSKAPDEIFNDYYKFLKWNELLADKVISEEMNLPRFDIIYCNNWMSWRSAQSIQRRLGGKIVVAVHFLQRQYKNMKQNPVEAHDLQIIAIEAEMLRLSSAIVCFSMNSAELLKEYGDSLLEKTYIINHTSSVPEKPVVVSKKDIYSLAYVGRLTEDKGVMELVEVCDQLVCNHPITLHVIGEGPLSKKLNEYPGKFIKTYGFIEDKTKLGRVLAKCAFSCLFSTSEVFPISIVESMMCGAFPIISDLPTIPVMFEQNVSGIRVGSLYDKAEICLIADIISDLMSNRKILFEKQNAAIDFYYKHYSLKRMIEETLSVFKTIATVI